MQLILELTVKYKHAGLKLAHLGASGCVIAGVQRAKGEGGGGGADESEEERREENGNGKHGIYKVAAHSLSRILQLNKVTAFSLFKSFLPSQISIY